MQFEKISAFQELLDRVEKAGFLPFFCHELQGFSVEEMIDPKFWFAEDRDGPWEWKGPAAAGKQCAYGKLFEGRAGFVSRKWYPDLANYRRCGYDFEGWYEDGHASRIDAEIMKILTEEGPCLSTQLKKICRDKGLKGFDAAITRLQMQTFITVADFEYRKDRLGQPYGWGIAKYADSDSFFGLEYMQSAAFARSPEESEERIRRHLGEILPAASREQIEKLIHYKR